jgi:ABC-type polysaccharide/polyol phosphate export permease
MDGGEAGSLADPRRVIHSWVGARWSGGWASGRWVAGGDHAIVERSTHYDYWYITRELTVTAFKLRDQGTFLGFLWTLLQPLAMLSVLYWLFRKQIGPEIEHFGLYLLTGIVLWTFFASGTARGLLSLVQRRDLILSVTFPRELIVLSSVLTVMFSSTLEFGVVLGFALGSGAGISWTWLWLPVILLMTGVLVIGGALLFSPWYVYARDLDNIWNIVLRMGFFLSPIFYLPETLLEPAHLRIYMLNPVAQIMTQARGVLLHHQLPSLGDTAYTVAVCVAIFLVGLVNFRYFSRDVAEHI